MTTRPVSLRLPNDVFDFLNKDRGLCSLNGYIGTILSLYVEGAQEDQNQTQEPIKVIN